MSKLLKANFMRLGKSSSFLLCSIIQVFLAAINFFTAYFIYSEKDLVFSRSFMVGSYIMIFFSIFITSFICTDYSCQTIRNKLIVGHSRAALYFSNFITAWIGSLVIAAAYLITIAVLTVFLGLETGMPPNELCFFILTQIAAVTALVSFYVLLSELITSKSKAVTTALILSLVLSIMYPIMGDMHIGFNVQAAKVISNAISVFFTDIMPSGQLVQMEMGADIQRIFPVYSLAVTAASSAIGILIFKRKGLK